MGVSGRQYERPNNTPFPFPPPPREELLRGLQCYPFHPDHDDVSDQFFPFMSTPTSATASPPFTNGHVQVSVSSWCGIDVCPIQRRVSLTSVTHAGFWRPDLAFAHLSSPHGRAVALLVAFSPRPRRFGTVSENTRRTKRPAAPETLYAYEEAVFVPFAPSVLQVIQASSRLFPHKDTVINLATYSCPLCGCKVSPF